MTTKQSGIAVVWLKRDFRLRDHGALHQAISSHQQLVLLYVCENSLRKEPHSSERHFDFIKQSISDLNRQLIPFNTKVLALKGEVIPVLDKLHRKINVAGLYSHLETGIDLTFKRDKNVQKWCTENNIPWKEERQQGVFRGMQNRKEWIQQ
ncbi:deoxyribodipyrimidine photo-lyase, partial [Flavobacteriaceae bacterium]|nr:deoxyribodipyrimidine photo-lyase [Flavobacteriaceae bacterium]